MRKKKTPLMSKIKSRLSAIMELAIPLGTFALIGARAMYDRKLGIALVALALLLACDFHRDYNKKYMLVVAIPYGPTLVPHEQLLVTHVSRMSDGSLCFDLVQEAKPGCIKTPNYYLIEQSVQ